MEMICPTCSAKTMLGIAWIGKRRTSPDQPNVFAQYRCREGHYFETLSIFTDNGYEEHYIPFGEPKRNTRVSIN